MEDVRDSNGKAITIKDGCPLSISTKSKLGKTLLRFGCSEEQIEENYGKEMETDEFLKTGTKVTLMTVNEKADKGTFARVVDGSLKPAK